MLVDQRFSGNSSRNDNKQSTEFFSGSLDDIRSETDHNSGIPDNHASVEFDTMRRASISVREAERKSENDTEMVREKEPVLPGLDEFNRMSNTRDLSSLTNQILELIIDNVKMTHINQKLVEYFKM